MLHYAKHNSPKRMLCVIQSHILDRLNLTVSIWLGAMDHHGHMEASGHQVHVAVRDPGNVTVKYWHHRLLWPGLTNFLFELSDRPPSGMWTVHVTLVDTAYSEEQRHQRRVSFAVLEDDRIDHISDADDAEASNSTAVYAAESHFVELNFSRRTALYFQPHLPFAGEVLESFQRFIHFRSSAN